MTGVFHGTLTKMNVSVLLKGQQSDEKSGTPSEQNLEAGNGSRDEKLQLFFFF